MLTGQLPFQETFSLDLIYAIIARPPPPISHFIPDIPKELSEIIMHLLEKNVENRYQSIFGVQRDLQQFMSDPTKFKLGK
jgi:serine/threonine protein kinase